MTDSIRQFAIGHASHLRKNLARQIRRAARGIDEKSVHDLRVSIRRLSQCLDEFNQFFPRHKTKAALKRLAGLMRLTAKMRNRDIAIGLLDGGHAKLIAELERERDKAGRKLARSLDRWRHHALR